MNEHERPVEEAEDPAVGHARTLAELVEADAVRKRDQARQVFGLYPDDQQEETPDAAA